MLINIIHLINKLLFIVIFYIFNNYFKFVYSFRHNDIQYQFSLSVYTHEPLPQRFCTTRAGKTIIIQKTQEMALESALILQLRYNNFREYHSNLLRNSLYENFNQPGLKNVVLKTIKNTLFEIAMANAGYNVEKYSITFSNMFLFIKDCNMVPKIIKYIFKLRNGSKFFKTNLNILNAWFSNIMLSPQSVEQLRFITDIDLLYCKIANSIRHVYSRIPKTINGIPFKLTNTLGLYRDKLKS